MRKNTNYTAWGKTHWFVSTKPSSYYYYYYTTTISTTTSLLQPLLIDSWAKKPVSCPVNIDPTWLYKEFNKKQKLIIALDCGIKAHKQVDYAKEKGIEFIICDHHNPDIKIPNALAVLNPKRKDCTYPYKELCGCGVGFKLIQALETKQSKDNQIINYLDLVALAIAADVVPLTGENRILAFIGLQIINSNPKLGIHSLLKRNPKKEIGSNCEQWAWNEKRTKEQTREYRATEYNSRHLGGYFPR